MNGDQQFARDYLETFLPWYSNLESSPEVVLIPPAYLLAGMNVVAPQLLFAGQNVSEFEAGAYTGEVSANMLADAGCRWCLVGHSERRALFGETEARIIAKIERLFAASLNPILCVGETLEQREAGTAEAIVGAQVGAVFDALDEQNLEHLVLAYEPVWAIGTGRTATPEQAQDMHAYIRACIAKKSPALAEKVRILYGGSVNAANAKTLFAQQDIDGGLVGGAALKVEEFMKICESMG